MKKIVRAGIINRDITIREPEVVAVPCYDDLIDIVFHADNIVAAVHGHGPDMAGPVHVVLITVHI